VRFLNLFSVHLQITQNLCENKRTRLKNGEIMTKNLLQSKEMFNSKGCANLYKENFTLEFSMNMYFWVTVK